MPPCKTASCVRSRRWSAPCATWPTRNTTRASPARSEEHTSELQSRLHLVCRLLLENKNSNAQLASFLPEIGAAGIFHVRLPSSHSLSDPPDSSQLLLAQPSRFPSLHLFN